MYPASKRWANVPIPRSQSCTQFLGSCKGFAESGLLRINVEHITLSLGPHTLTQPDATTTISDSSPTATTPECRQKYVAFGSTSGPPSANPVSPSPQAGTSNFHGSMMQ